MSESEPVDSDPLLGRRFGSYVVEEKLGEGGMGAVYRAIQPEIGKQVAIKFLAPHLSQNPSVVQRFFAEARSVNLIQHDNIVDIFDFGQVEGFSFFVMELMKGTSLEALLQAHGRLEVGRAVDIALQVADAISAAHARNIIHRDLKPDNIFLVTRSGRQDFVKLLDFGIAKLADSSSGVSLGRTMAGAVLGTPGYMSPEQGTGGTVDARTDVYALGVILFRMLAGRLPFEGMSFPEILQKQLVEPPPNLRALRPELSASLAQLVHQMVTREVDDRPQTMAQVVERLEQGAQAGGREASQPFRVSSPGDSSGRLEFVGVGPASMPGQTTLSGAAGSYSSGHEQIEGPPRRSAGLAVGIGALLLVAVVGVLAIALSRKKTEEPPRAVVATQAATPAPSPTPAPTVATPTPAPPAPELPTPAPAEKSAYVETQPPGAQVLINGKPVATTPGRVALPGDSVLVHVHLAGYRDESLELSDGQQTVIRLHKEVVRAEPPPPVAHAPVRLPPPPPVPTGHTPPKPPKKPAIGLDD
jgi:serine/threonine-protein kinase